MNPKAPLINANWDVCSLHSHPLFLSDSRFVGKERNLFFYLFFEASRTRKNCDNGLFEREYQINAYSFFTWLTNDHSQNITLLLWPQWKFTAAGPVPKHSLTQVQIKTCGRNQVFVSGFRQIQEETASLAGWDHFYTLFGFSFRSWYATCLQSLC